MNNKTVFTSTNTKTNLPQYYLQNITKFREYYIKNRMYKIEYQRQYRDKLKDTIKNKVVFSVPKITRNGKKKNEGVSIKQGEFYVHWD